MGDSNALVVREAPSMVPATVSVLTEDGFKAAMSLAEKLCESGFLPRAVNKPAQALAIILAGQELGIPPMQSLRQIHIVEGKPTLSAELMLSLWKRRGGKANWVESTNEKAVLHLRHPNGDEHTETFSIADAQRAQVTGKDNWRKYPKAMLRARAISAGIRALGEADGFYDPEEMGDEEYTPPKAAAPSAPATTTGGCVSPPSDEVPHDPVTGEVLDDSADVRAFERLADAPKDDNGGTVPVNRWNDRTQAWEPSGETAPKLRGDQLRRIHALRNELGHLLDRRVNPPAHARFNPDGSPVKATIEKGGKYYASLRKVFGKEHTNELSVAEAERVIATLLGMKDKADAKVERATKDIAEGLQHIAGGVPSGQEGFVSTVMGVAQGMREREPGEEG